MTTSYIQYCSLPQNKRRRLTKDFIHHHAVKVMIWNDSINCDQQLTRQRVNRFCDSRNVDKESEAKEGNNKRVRIMNGTRKAKMLSLLLAGIFMMKNFYDHAIIASMPDFTNNSIDIEQEMIEESQKQKLLGCNDIQNIEIIRELGKGKAKVTYEVKLPSGESALAKRCIHDNCLRQGLLTGEFRHLKKLQDQYGKENTISVYGMCDAPYAEGGIDLQKGTRTSRKRNSRHLRIIASDFTEGYTAFFEMGVPLLTKWRDGVKFRKCFASYFTDADVDSFRVIARQYAGFAGSPIMLGQPGYFSDNIWAEQYIIAKAGARHADLDMLFHCQNCTYEEALTHNCIIVQDVVFHKRMNCSLAFSLEHPILNLDEHINATEAERQCTLTVGESLPKPRPTPKPKLESESLKF